LDWSGKAAISLLSEAVEAGVGNQGYSIPIRGLSGQFALFNTSTTATDAVWAAFTEKNRRNLIICAHAFSQKALELKGKRMPEPIKPVSGRKQYDACHCARGL
jgi:hypothetical protein